MLGWPTTWKAGEGVRTLDIQLGKLRSRRFNPNKLHHQIAAKKISLSGILGVNSMRQPMQSSVIIDVV
jgi:hypothetical protein